MDRLAAQTRFTHRCPAGLALSSLPGKPQYRALFSSSTSSVSAMSQAPSGGNDHLLYHVPVVPTHTHTHYFTRRFPSVPRCAGRLCGSLVLGPPVYYPVPGNSRSSSNVHRKKGTGWWPDWGNGPSYVSQSFSDYWTPQT